jgi:hypothetical protein
MTKLADGIWSATVGPVEPEIYQYNFVVDGVRILGPGTPNLKNGRTIDAGIVEVPGNPPRFDQIQPVPHGALQIRAYTSTPWKKLRTLYLTSLTWAAPAPDTSAGSLMATVRDAIRARRPDRDIAGVVRAAQLTERLDDRALEELQSEGAGSETMEELDRQREVSRLLPKPRQPLTWFDAPPAPTTPEQSEILEKARGWALQYTGSLPNFICIESVRRYVDSKGLTLWEPRDVLTLAVAFSEKGEQYKVLTINDRPTRKTFNDVGGYKSGGEFGSLLRQIFGPESAAQFQWERWSNLRGRPAHVFSYRIEQARSKYHMKLKVFLKSYEMTSGMRGLVYVDRETNRVMRYAAEAESIPENWPILRTPSVVDYDFADIGGQPYLLPRRVDSRVVTRRQQSRNVLEFTNYRKFSGESSVTFEKQ